MITSIYDTTLYLFSCNFFDDSFDPEGQEEHLDRAYELQKSYPWIDIITEWHNYLYNKCKTPEEVINFANLFFYYEGVSNYNPEPYKFLGYLYAKVDMDIYWDIAGDLFDSIAIDVLQNQCLIDLTENPYYNPLEDSNVIVEIDKWKQNFH
jgi:hypothetical protein